MLISISSVGNDPLLCQISRKIGIPDFECSGPKHILPVSRLQPGLEKKIAKPCVAIRAQAMGSQQRCSVLSRNRSLVHAAAPTATVLSIPVLGGCHTGPRSQPEPKWHLAPLLDTVPQPLGQEASELQLAGGWRGSTWRLLLARPIPTLLPCPQGGPQDTNLHNPSLTSCTHHVQKNSEKGKSKQTRSFAFSKCFSGLVDKDNVWFFGKQMYKALPNAPPPDLPAGPHVSLGGCVCTHLVCYAFAMISRD